MTIHCMANCLHEKDGICQTIPVFQPLIEIEGLGKFPQCTSREERGMSGNGSVQRRVQAPTTRNVHYRTSV